MTGMYLSVYSPSSKVSMSEVVSSNPPVILKGDNLVDGSSIPASARNSRSSSVLDVWKNS